MVLDGDEEGHRRPPDRAGCPRQKHLGKAGHGRTLHQFGSLEHKELRETQVLKVPTSLHALMQNTNDCNSVMSRAKIDEVAFDATSTIALSNGIDLLGEVRRGGEFGADGLY